MIFGAWMTSVLVSRCSKRSVACTCVKESAPKTVSGVTVLPKFSAGSANGPPAGFGIIQSSQPPEPSLNGKVIGIWPPVIVTCGPLSP